MNSPVTATFSEAMTASTISSSTFTLTAAGNPVTGTVTYSASSNTATFTPSANLNYGTQYTATITTGVTASNGAALAANDTFTFTTVAATPPTVTSVTPTSGATGVSIGTTVTATFSEAMTASTISSSTFTLTPQGGAAISGTVVSYTSTSNVATLTPPSPLAYSTQYTATITTGVQSSQGAALAANYTWSFTTMPAPVPSVTAVTPTNNATDVALNTALTATFSIPMNSSTITSSTFTLMTQSNTAVTGNVTCNTPCTVATFTPSSNLAANTTFTATLTTGVQSSAGGALAAAYTWSFSTPPAPTVTGVSPTAGATGVSVTPVLSATFNSAMNASTITSSTFTLNATGGASVTGTVAYNSTTYVATFTPSAALAATTSYTATITTGATSAAGAPLAANYVWVFSTGLAPTPVTVDFGTTYQTIDGFGGSTAWLGPMPAAVAKALYNPTDGIGLSILRMRIDPEGVASGGGSQGDPFETGEWDYEATNGQEAVTNNPNAKVFATPWTPPAMWKLNGTSTTIDGNTWNEALYSGSCSPGGDDESGDPGGYCGGYLDPNHYGDYAAYLEDFVTFYNSQVTVPLYAISMQNEPEENVDYESCVWTPAQMDAFVASLTAGGATNPITTKLIMPEADSFQTIQAQTTLEDANAEGNVSIIGGHLYGVSPALYPIPAGDSPKDVWMTEFGPLSPATLPWTSTNAQSALDTFALSIHDALVNGQYNAYVWWGVFGASVGSCGTSAGTCGLVDDGGNLLPMGEVFGQFSKFIQPGYVRASATATPTTGVYVSAYENTTPEHYVIVAINTNTTAKNMAFTIANGTVTSVTPYQSTSATGGLAAQPAVSVTGGQFTYVLPAQSIVTFVQ